MTIIEETTEITTTDPLTCEVCGRRNDDVRACCWRPGNQRTCSACYLSGKGDHFTHVTDRYKIVPEQK